MSTISLRAASLARQSSVAAFEDNPNRHNPARGMIVGVALGAGLWTALFAGLAIL